MVRALAVGYRQVDLSAGDRAMLDYAVLLTRDPVAVGHDGVRMLRKAGFSDEAILDVCQITAYYNYVNRLADGLGVGLESSWTEDMMVVTLEEFQQLRRDREPYVGGS